MEANGLDAMFMFTVSMGVITFLMAWVILVIAIKGCEEGTQSESDKEIWISSWCGVMEQDEVRFGGIIGVWSYHFRFMRRIYLILIFVAVFSWVCLSRRP